MAMIFPAEPLRPEDRFDAWQEVVSSTYGLVASQPLNEAPFDGRLNVRGQGSVTFTRIQSSPLHYRRLQQDRESDHFLLTLSLCPDALVVQNDRESRQGAGDIVLYDSAQPYACSYPEGDDQIVLTVPRKLLLQHIPSAECLVCRTLDGRSALGRVAAVVLTEAWNAEGLSDPLSERLNASLLDVLSTAFDSVFGDTDIRRQSHQMQQLQRIKQFLLNNLPDTGLTAENIALATHVSPRTLNRLFAQEGTTAIRWLWQQRLSACHDALLKRHVRRVSDAALNFGFTNLSHFSRAFKNAYGIPPQQLLEPR
ncbi:AraC family transcriptional regulator [Pseudomonas syringae pv. syringae]|uniref:helix-turn-helix domain-containing protein n=1 Tax=Pseudomonas syringae TaxID=317 RepID=UPI0007EE7A81|nr:helix-turn-helix domain-containing protein [Pseudomonas syringae]MBI6767573.1 helix-turn-helix domain-containing protein [Pseudomonas syringae]MBI6780472.1 helix-turn-helix domain-containing protein [Pseudomonas syringae]MBI6786813.1 helix-turn-helix domain-containing protein [Pseudomonas syringae]MBI6799167.1 helix-turn-helix domain-containing protein [Pseudomonas syringae]MDC3740230.1 helix-turn-helix domain-containing protein [Pseudomonas syringae pv. syringae]